MPKGYQYPLALCCGSGFGPRFGTGWIGAYLMDTEMSPANLDPNPSPDPNPALIIDNYPVLVFNHPIRSKTDWIRNTGLANDPRNLFECYQYPKALYDRFGL
jgi:hypothetical protein